MSETVAPAPRIFVDDTIHDGDGFVLTAAIVSFDDLAPSIAALLDAAGLVPGRDEYKSSAPKGANEQSRRLRAELSGLLHQYGQTRIAIAITPREERDTAGADMLTLLAHLKASSVLGVAPVTVHLDDGLMNHVGRSWLRENPDCGLVISPESDSRKVLELQLADLVAHTAAIVLKSELGSTPKMIAPGPANGYHPDERFPIGFEMWASLRYNLAGRLSMTHAELDEMGGRPIVPAYGLYVNPRCDPRIHEVAHRKLGSVYLGCIH
jgi:hypothetical protein